MGCGGECEGNGLRNSAHGADKFGLKELAAVHWNLPDTVLTERRDRHRRGLAGRRAAPSAPRPAFTPAAVPKDKFVVVDAQTEKTVWWEKNGRLPPEKFQLLFDDFIAHAKGKTLYAQDLYGGADPKYRIKVRVYNELAWHSMFIRALLIRPDRSRAFALRSRLHHPVAAVVQGRSQAARRAQRNHHRHRLHEARSS